MPMIKVKNKVWLYAPVIVIVIITVAVFLAYQTPSRFLRGIFPAAIIRGLFISLNSWDDARAAAAKFDGGYSPKAVFDQLIKTEQERQLAGRVNLAAELNYIKAGKDIEYQDILNKYFNDQMILFEKLVVAPQAYDAALRVKYNSNFGLNDATYRRAKQILSDLKSGKEFDKLAQTQSDDQVSGQLGGDLGFVLLDQLLPEVSQKLQIMPLGKISDEIVTSRWGYHILYPVETAERGGQTVYHIKQILIATSGYDDWLNLQLEKFSVWRIVKP